MKMSLATIISIVVTAIAFMLLLASFVVIDAGYVGVVKRLGAVQPDYLPEGFHIKTPFIEIVEEFDVRLSKVETEAGASSRDLQVVRTEIAVQYSMTPELMPLTLQKIGTRGVVERTLIAPSIMESVKAITAVIAFTDSIIDGAISVRSTTPLVPIFCRVSGMSSGVIEYWTAISVRTTCKSLDDAPASVSTLLKRTSNSSTISINGVLI